MDHLLKVQAIFRDFFDDPTLLVEAATSPMTIADWDSVAQVQIVLAVEETFEMQFTTYEVAKIHCVGDILQVLESRG
jgi:acyl carrier protein